MTRYLTRSLGLSLLPLAERHHHHLRLTLKS